MRIEWTRRRLGYVVWGFGFLVIVVPELLAAWSKTERWLPFPTISRTVGHLEGVNPLWEIFPTALIVLFVYALMRVPLPAPGATVQLPDDGDGAAPHELPRFFVTSAIFVAVVAGATLAAAEAWPDQHLVGETGKQPNFYVAYFLWGGSFLLWVVLPTWSALRKNHKFPSLPRTVINLTKWLARDRRPPWWDRICKAFAWVVGFATVWGMAFLLLHLTLYPFPDITRELNKHEIVCTDVLDKDGSPSVVSRMPRDRDPSCRLGHYPNLGG